jgi:MFS transporter, SHS family, lactate transporter
MKASSRHAVLAGFLGWTLDAFDFFGQLSQRIGRRYSMLAALAVSLVVIPLWAFGATIGVLATAACVMQMGVQGA